MNCLHWFMAHHWEKWKVISGGDVIDAEYQDGVATGKRIRTAVYEIQRRECLFCGKSQLREARS